MNEPPPKPWEINRSQNASGMVPLHSNLNPNSQEPLVPVQDTVRKQTPPPVPRRPGQGTSTPIGYQPSYGGMGGFGSYGGYGTGYGGIYSGGGMYGGYGNSMYGGYNRTGYGTPGGFARQAEESTRNAFQSVESIVRAFTSVSAMLESTLGAVYSSFRAVLDVADQFSRVRATFADILSSITIFRLIRYLYRRVKAFFNFGDSCDEAWDSVKTDQSITPKKRRSKSWPILLFITVVLGGPYLIWKLLSGGASAPKEPTTWASGLSDHVVAKVEYDFEATNDDELSVKAGEQLNLAPREQQPYAREWVWASADGVNQGMVPANYVKILGKRKGRQPQADQLQQSQQSN